MNSTRKKKWTATQEAKRTRLQPDLEKAKNGVPSNGKEALTNKKTKGHCPNQATKESHAQCQSQ